MLIFEIIFLSQYIDSLILEGIQISYEEEFSKAESIFNIVINNDTLHPAGYFFKSALYQLKYFDMGYDSIKEFFFNLQKKGISVAKRYVEKNPDDPWGYFFLGGFHTLNVFLYGYNGDYINALKNLFPALDNINKSVKMDSTIYDAYLGLGGYDYFKGMLPFMGSEKEKAFKEIKISIDKGKYTRFLSSSALANLYIREKRYEDARKIIKELIREFPGSRTFLWHYFNSFYYEGEIDSAIYYGYKLMELSKDNYYCYIQSVYFISELLLKKGEKKKVREITENIRDDLFPEWSKKIKILREKSFK
uniref:Uncharacterized protein n=1 Tax=candidate division WOR-3 bacterium TaxID=2052148 RepID=A0A7C4U7N5_UNCW3